MRIIKMQIYDEICFLRADLRADGLWSNTSAGAKLKWCREAAAVLTGLMFSVRGKKDGGDGISYYSLRWKMETGNI